MRVTVRDFEKEYSFSLKGVTQLCGQNLINKSFVLESVRRYYSGYKYSEGRNPWRDNVLVDGKSTGRKYFAIWSVSTKKELVDAIKLSKQSVMQDYIKYLLNRFDSQQYIKRIEDELEGIYVGMNSEISKLGPIELTYEVSDLWGIIQKSTMMTDTGAEIEEKSIAELIHIYLNLLKEIFLYNPQKSLLIFENMDHMVTREEFRNIIYVLKDFSEKYDVYAIISTSLTGYPVVNSELIEGITVFNDVEFTFPEADRLIEFINESYPIQYEFTMEQVIEAIKKTIHNIGRSDLLYGAKSVIISKLINQSLMIKECVDISASFPEIQFTNN